MRRKTANVVNSKQKAFVYVCGVLALAAYGIPRIPELHHGLAGTFSVVWILFAALAVAANVYFLVGADHERSRMLETRDAAVMDLDKKQRGEHVRRRAY